MINLINIYIINIITNITFIKIMEMLYFIVENYLLYNFELRWWIIKLYINNSVILK